MTVRVRNLRKGEHLSLPPALLDHGCPYLAEDWAWAAEVAEVDSQPSPFALIVTAFAHGWLVLFRILALSPLPPAVPLNWFLEALPQVFAEARLRGCVGFMTMLADNRPQEVKLARIVQRLPGTALLPMQGVMAVGLLETVTATAATTSAAATGAAAAMDNELTLA